MLIESSSEIKRKRKSRSFEAQNCQHLLCGERDIHTNEKRPLKQKSREISLFLLI